MEPADDYAGLGALRQARATDDSQGDTVGIYRVQAEIAAVHSTARIPGLVDWASIIGIRRYRRPGRSTASRRTTRRRGDALAAYREALATAPTDGVRLHFQRWVAELCPLA